MPRGAPIITREKSTNDNPSGVNFGHNYRYLGHFVRVTFLKITGTLCTHLSVPLLNYFAPSEQACMHGGAHICSVTLSDVFLCGLLRAL